MPVNPPAPLNPPASAGSPIALAAAAAQARIAAERAADVASLAQHEPAESPPAPDHADLAAIDAAFGKGDAAPLVPPTLEATHEFDGVAANDAGPAPVVAVDPPAEEAPEADESQTALAGKRVVLYNDFEMVGWHEVREEVAGNRYTPLLYDGTRDDAIKEALDDERNKTLADLVRADPARFLLVSVPASSWAPAPVEPFVTKTTWRVKR